MKTNIKDNMGQHVRRRHGRLGQGREGFADVGMSKKEHKRDGFLGNGRARSRITRDLSEEKCSLELCHPNVTVLPPVIEEGLLLL